MAARFLTLADVTEVLNISAPQAYALLRSGELPGIQIGRRGIWRVEATELEAYIERMYAQARSRAAAGERGEHSDDELADDDRGGERGAVRSEARHEV